MIKPPKFLAREASCVFISSPRSHLPFSCPSTIMIETLLSGLSGLDHALFEPSENVSFFFYSPNGGVSII